MTGAEVRQRRLELGWTQAELAKRACVTHSYVSYIEAGKRIAKETMKRIVFVLTGGKEEE